MTDISTSGRYWQAVRIVGLAGFVALLTAFLLGRDVPAFWLVVVGGMIGLEPILGWKGRQNGEVREP